HFVSKETFLEMVKQKRFVEYTLYNDNYYGTPFCEEHENEIIIFDLDRNGVKSLMNSGVKCLFIYIHCDVEDLKERLYKRLGNSISQENLNDIEKRISRIEKDLEVFRKEDYDLVVENSDLYQTYKTINKEKSATNDTCCEDTATLLQGVSVYKYLGIIEDSRRIPTRSSFEEVQNKLISRVERLCHTRLNAKNLFSAINQHAISLINYHIGV
ncbi:guanylate kinase, partial [Hamiltosporidium magnivora]